MNINSLAFLSSAFYPASVGTFVTTLIGLSTLQSESPFVSSSVFALPFLITIFVAPLMARAIKNRSPETLLNLQYISRFLVAVAVSFCCYYIYKQSNNVLIPYIFLMLLLSGDQVLTSDAPLLANQVYNTAFSRTTAFGNLFTRGFQSITPLLAAYMIVENRNGFWILVIALSLLYGFFYPHILSKHSNIQLALPDKKAGANKPIYTPYHTNKAWGLWFISFNVLVNLSQGAVAFVLISVDPKLYGPIYSSVLYGAFLIIQILVVSGLVDFQNFSARPSTVGIFLLINAFGLSVLAFLTNFWFIAGAVSLIGLVYGVSVPLLSEVILARLRGPNFRQHLANAKSGGRLASVLALWLAGIALSAGVASNHLLLLSGVLLGLSAVLLFVIASRLEKAERLSIT
ncbi:hypothetical protein CQ054_21320 [Ochrobactrum sp. MYb29]|nr:hypothetical protein CQ054_21320 [Ochrobactrum sp. MYb29]